MRTIFLYSGLFCLSVFTFLSSKAQEKTAFQTASPWMPEIDIRSDVAIIYGVHGNPSDKEQNSTFEGRVKSWHEKGYNTHFMTGIAWGAYQDYFLGKWDGRNHFDEGQVEVGGDTIWHGHNVPYIVPQQSFINYIKEQVIERVIDAGITSIYLEEPEFWARAGYSEAFKKEWQSYYGFSWRPQHESPENTYLSSKLKYELYYQAIEEVSSYAKKYGKSKGIEVKVYIPTHSLVNYSSWKIVSPEASLASLPGIDGYIAQVWTGTSREPVYFNGLRKERVFENAFLEYGSMVSMTAPTGRKIFFLTDPIEDWPRDWGDYKRNYQATFTAKLLYPMVANYEVMPWPERIYTRPYKLANSDSSVLIPRYYSTQMQVMINALNDMPLSENKLNGSHGIGVLMGNSLMFQRFPTHEGYEDPQLSNFYGMILPLVKRGIPAEMVHMENLETAEALKDIKVLIMSYANMKPHAPGVHGRLAEWVKKGGILLYYGRDQDPFQHVREWWNTKGNDYEAPSQHLFETLGIQPDPGVYTVGRGKVRIVRRDPKELVLTPGQDQAFLKEVRESYEQHARAGKLISKNNFYLERGPYIIAAVLDEHEDKSPLIVEGPLIDLFDPELPVLDKKQVLPGEQTFLYSFAAIADPGKPRVLAAACRVYEEEASENSYSFLTKSPDNTRNVMRILLPSEPREILVSSPGGKGDGPFSREWDQQTRTLKLAFDNSSEGVRVQILF